MTEHERELRMHRYIFSVGYWAGWLILESTCDDAEGVEDTLRAELGTEGESIVSALFTFAIVRGQEDRLLAAQPVLHFGVTP